MGDSETTAFVLEQRIRPDESDAVRELVADRASDDATELLANESVQTVSLFLHQKAATSNALVWYVEVQAGTQNAPADFQQLVRESSLFDAGLRDLLESSKSERVFADGTADDLLVHTTHPERDQLPPGEDVVLVRLAIRSGLGERLVGGLARLINWLEGGRVEAKMQASSEKVLEDEGMLTESIFLDTENGLALLWYMESEEMEQVMDAYHETSNPVARGSELVLGLVLERPEVLLGTPLDDAEYELLAHAVDETRA